MTLCADLNILRLHHFPGNATRRGGIETTRKERENESPPDELERIAKEVGKREQFFFLLDCIQPLIFFCLERNCVYIRNWYAVAVPCRKISIRYIPNSTQGIFVNVSKKRKNGKTMDGLDDDMN